MPTPGGSEPTVRSRLNRTCRSPAQKFIDSIYTYLGERRSPEAWNGAISNITENAINQMIHGPKVKMEVKISHLDVLLYAILKVGKDGRINDLQKATVSMELKDLFNLSQTWYFYQIDRYPDKA